MLDPPAGGRRPRASGPEGALRPTPFLHVLDALGPGELRDLLDQVEAQVARLPIGPAAGAEAAASAPTGPTIDLGPGWATLEHRLRDLAGHVRRELGLEHFGVESVYYELTAYDGSAARKMLSAGSGVVGTPRISFVYTLRPPGSSCTGGAVRLYDSVEDDGPIRAAETFSEIEALDNSIIFFPSDRHHEIGRVGSEGDGSPIRYVITGSLVDTPRRSVGSGIDLDVAARRVLQHRYLPTLSESGFEVRVTPPAVQAFLESLLELRGGTRHGEQADPSFHRNGSPDLVDVSDLSDRILRWLQPVHEEFAGAPLVPSNVYGLRVYVRGNTLDMHVDRGTTHVISSVLQIAQDVDEPWPLVIDWGGRSHEVYLAPGQMVLYEGATSDHGRPTPLCGNSFVNLFAHYRPADWAWTDAALAAHGKRNGVITAGGALAASNGVPAV
jgi:hypothetical protein